MASATSPDCQAFYAFQEMREMKVLLFLELKEELVFQNYLRLRRHRSYLSILLPNLLEYSSVEVMSLLHKQKKTKLHKTSRRNCKYTNALVTRYTQGDARHLGLGISSKGLCSEQLYATHMDIRLMRYTEESSREVAW